jgi:hypothetical protein
MMFACCFKLVVASPSSSTVTVIGKGKIYGRLPVIERLSPAYVSRCSSDFIMRFMLGFADHHVDEPQNLPPCLCLPFLNAER